MAAAIQAILSNAPCAPRPPPPAPPPPALRECCAVPLLLCCGNFLLAAVIPRCAAVRPSARHGLGGRRVCGEQLSQCGWAGGCGGARGFASILCRTVLLLFATRGSSAMLGSAATLCLPLNPSFFAEGLDRRPGTFWRFYLNSSWYQLLMDPSITLQDCTDGERACLASGLFADHSVGLFRACAPASDDRPGFAELYYIEAAHCCWKTVVSSAATAAAAAHAAIRPAPSSFPLGHAQPASRSCCLFYTHLRHLAARLTSLQAPAPLLSSLPQPASRSRAACSTRTWDTHSASCRIPAASSPRATTPRPTTHSWRPTACCGAVSCQWLPWRAHLLLHLNRKRRQHWPANPMQHPSAQLVGGCLTTGLWAASASTGYCRSNRLCLRQLLSRSPPPCASAGDAVLCPPYSQDYSNSCQCSDSSVPADLPKIESGRGENE